MRNLLALVGAAVIGFGVVGYYQGWYKLDVSKSADGNIRVETNVNTNKVVTDSGDAFKKISSTVGDQIDKAGKDTKAGAAPTPGATPGPVKNDDKDKFDFFGFDLNDAGK